MGSSLTVKQEQMLDHIRTDLALRGEYTALIREISQHEKTIVKIQSIIDNFMAGSFKPPNNDISPWKNGVKDHRQTVEKLKERAQQIRDVLFKRSDAINMLRIAYSEVPLEDLDD